MDIQIISEEDVARLVSRSAIFDRVEDMFAAMANDQARNFPVVRELLGHADAIYGFKSGFDRSAHVLGVKAGGYWPGNMAKGIMNHQSTVVLFDPDTGQCQALVSGNRLTALRTAASSAVSIKHLARENATALGLLGAGGQAEFQVRAALEQRQFDTLIIADRSKDQSQRLKNALGDTKLDIKIADPEAMARISDVIITVTPSFEPVLRAEWIKPGTHLACMGADTAGKQEVEQAIFSRARAFTDEVAQSVSIGECQHAFQGGLLSKDQITPIGAVITGKEIGRTNSLEITLFDGTGVGLQDLVAAQLALELTA